MALKFLTGYDHYANADLTLGVRPRFTGAVVGTGITTSNFRNGSRCLRLSSASDYVYRSGMSNDVTCTLGAAVRFESLADTGRVFMAISDGDPRTAGNVHMGLALAASGKLAVFRGRALGSASGGTQLGSDSTNTVSGTNTYMFIELLCTVDDTVGVATVRVNGSSVNWIALTGQDTKATSNAYANAFGLGGLSGALSYDDTYFDTILNGDVKATALNASTGNGTNAQSTPSTSTDRGALVDETVPSTSDYNTLITVGHKDTYNFPALSSVTGVILGLNVHNYVAKTDAGTCDGQAQAYIGTTLYDGTQQALSQTAGYDTELFVASPATATNWSVAEVDAAEFGYKRAA